MARGAPVISHLFFADDSLLFFKTCKEEAKVIKNVLSVYEKSEQLVNFNKSTIRFSLNMKPEVCE